VQHEEVKQAVRTWRNPRRVDLDNHMPNQARNEVASGSGGNPVKLEAAEKSEIDSQATFTPEDDEADAFTVIDSDESDASIFGLRHVLRDAEEDERESNHQSKARCTIGTSQSCYKLQERFLLIQSGIKDERDDLLGYIASVEKHGEETKVTLETQP